jgi:hypothetical protein
MPTDNLTTAANKSVEPRAIVSSGFLAIASSADLFALGEWLQFLELCRNDISGEVRLDYRRHTLQNPPKN